jgi:hypothetical protein
MILSGMTCEQRNGGYVIDVCFSSETTSNKGFTVGIEYGSKLEHVANQLESVIRLIRRMDEHIKENPTL